MQKKTTNVTQHYESYLLVPAIDRSDQRMKGDGAMNSKRWILSKMYRVMKLLTFFLFAGFLTVYAESHSQTITLSSKKRSLQEVFTSIEKQTGYMIFGNEELIKTIPALTLSAQKMPLLEFLELVFKRQAISFSIEDKTIFLTKTPLKNDVLKPDQGLFASVQNGLISGRVINTLGLALSGITFSKDKKAVGVSDAAGSFSISVSAGDVITVSAVGYAGLKFKVISPENMPDSLKHLQVDQRKPVLRVAFLGTDQGSNRSALQNTKAGLVIKLAAKIAELEEVSVSVSTGYQNIIKDRMTGSYVTITAKDLENSNFMSLDKALEGKVAGLYSRTVNGAPGAKAEVRIRGDNSINGSKEPLWVVDGLPLQQGVLSINDLTQGNIQQSILDHGIGNLNPSDIETVTILKDAAATTIYGARASNGVIVVTTKKGGEGPISITYQGNYAIGSAPRMNNFGFMNANQKIDFEIDLMEEFQQRNENAGRVSRLWDQWKRGVYTNEQYDAQLAELRGVNMNWFKELYRTTFSQSHSLSMRGGGKKFWFYGSLRGTDEKGALFTNHYNQIGSNIDIGFRPNEKFKIGYNLSASFRQSKDHAASVDPFKYAVFANPYEKAYNEDGSYAADQTWLNDKSNLSVGYIYPNFNMLKEMRETSKIDRASDLTSTINASWKVNEHLQTEVIARVGYATNNGEASAAPGTYSSLANYWSTLPFSSSTSPEIPAKYNNGYMTISSGRSVSFSGRASISYSNTFAGVHYLNTFLGTEIASSQASNSRFKMAQYDPGYYFGSFPEYPWQPQFSNDMQGKINALSAYVYGNPDRTASLFGAATYSYDNRYVVNFNARFDGAGTIDEQNRFTPLWSASARWNIHQEKFIKNNSDFISTLALRYVFGYTGNIDKTALPYSWMVLYNSKYDDQYMAKKIYFPNPNIKWERKMDRNLGLDFAFLHNMVGGSFNYFNNITNDLLGKTETPPSYGNSRVVMNGHSLINKGWELMLNLRLPLGKDVNWFTSFNISHVTNRVKNSFFKDPANFKDPNQLNNWAGFVANDIEKYPVGTTFGYRYAGVNSANGEPMIYLSEVAREAYAAAHKISVDEAPKVWEINNSVIGGGLSREKWFMMSLTDIGTRNPTYYGGFSSSLQWKNLEFRASFSYAVGHRSRVFDSRNFNYSSFNTSSDIYGPRMNVLETSVNRWRLPGDETDVPRITKGQSMYFIMNTDDRFQRADYLSLQDVSVNYNFKFPALKAAGIDLLSIRLMADNVAAFSKFRSTNVTSSTAFGYPGTRKFYCNIQLTF